MNGETPRGELLAIQHRDLCELFASRYRDQLWFNGSRGWVGQAPGTRRSRWPLGVRRRLEVLLPEIWHELQIEIPGYTPRRPGGSP